MTILPHDLDIVVTDEDGDGLNVTEFSDFVSALMVRDGLGSISVHLTAKQARKVGIRLVRMAARIEARDVVARCS